MKWGVRLYVAGISDRKSKSIAESPQSTVEGEIGEEVRTRKPSNELIAAVSR